MKEARRRVYIWCLLVILEQEKTAFANIIGQLYKEENILKKGHLVEVNKSDLIGQYVGQTTLLVKKTM